MGKKDKKQTENEQPMGQCQKYPHTCNESKYQLDRRDGKEQKLCFKKINGQKRIIFDEKLLILRSKKLTNNPKMIIQRG